MFREVQREFEVFLLLEIIIPMIVFGIMYLFGGKMKNRIISASELSESTKQEECPLILDNAQTDIKLSANSENVWTLLEFVKQRRLKMQVATFKRPNTDETYKAIVFVNDLGEKTFANFSEALGELTPVEIAKRKHNLEIVQITLDEYCLRDTSESFVDLTD